MKLSHFWSILAKVAHIFVRVITLYYVIVVLVLISIRNYRLCFLFISRYILLNRDFVCCHC